MGESATDAIYIGTYVLIFIIAISITIILFTGIVDYADKSYEYGQNQTDSTISTNGATTYQKTKEDEDKVYLTADEVVSYYYNYIEKDLYDSDPSENADVKYRIKIYYDSNNPNKYYDTGESDSDAQILSGTHKDLLDNLNRYGGKYTLEYENEYFENGTKFICIDIKDIDDIEE